MKKTLLAVTATLLLSACTSSGKIALPELPSSSPRISVEDLYLRGVFNWWEATPAYRFKQDGVNWYVNVELIADGQPYDFKLSDSQWTPSQSCGGKYKGQPVILNTEVHLTCEQASETLQFTPSNTGNYRFAITDISSGEIAIKITRE